MNENNSGFSFFRKWIQCKYGYFRKEKTMTEKYWRIFAVLAAAGCLSVFLKWQYASGYVLGCIVSVITYKILERFCDNALKARNSSGTLGHFMINFGIWAAVLAFCAAFNQYFNVIACAIGLTAVKLSIIIGSILYRD